MRLTQTGRVQAVRGGNRRACVRRRRGRCEGGGGRARDLPNHPEPPHLPRDTNAWRELISDMCGGRNVRRPPDSKPGGFAWLSQVIGQ